MSDKIERVYDMFEESYIYKNEELILHKKWNIYFRLDNASTTTNPRPITPEEFDYKMLSYLSFYTAEHHFSKKTAQYKWALNRLKRWFRYDFTHSQLQDIYQKYGNGAHMQDGLEFIKNELT